MQVCKYLRDHYCGAIKKDDQQTMVGHKQSPVKMSVCTFCMRLLSYIIPNDRTCDVPSPLTWSSKQSIVRSKCLAKVQTPVPVRYAVRALTGRGALHTGRAESTLG